MQIRTFTQGLTSPLRAATNPNPNPGANPPADDEATLSAHRFERSMSGLFYGGFVLPLLGSAAAVAGQSPARVAAVALGGAAFSGLLTGGIAPKVDELTDPLSGWLRGAGMTAASLALGCVGGLQSMAVAAPLMAGAGYLTAGVDCPKEVKSPGLRAVGWLAALATNVAAPLLVYHTIDHGLGVAVGMLSGLSTLMLISPD